MENFNAPPGWPKPPQGWRPKPGWKPEPSWATAPADWHFWVNEWGEPVDGPPGLFGSTDIDATTAFSPEIAETPATTALPNSENRDKTGVIAGAVQASRERGAERAAAEARGTIPGAETDDASARKAVKWVASSIVVSVIFLALLAAFFHRSSTPSPAKSTVTTPAVTQTAQTTTPSQRAIASDSPSAIIPTTQAPTTSTATPSASTTSPATSTTATSTTSTTSTTAEPTQTTQTSSTTQTSQTSQTSDSTAVTTPASSAATTAAPSVATSTSG